MYIPLNNKTNYTLLSSLLRVDDLVSYAINNKIDYIGICDTNMYATLEFINKCKNNNIKPIIGLELILDKYRVNIICRNYTGYKSMIKLSTIQNERVIEKEDLLNYKDGLIGIINYKYKDYYKEVKDIYDELYIGYSDKQEEIESLLISKNIIFYKENLYINKNESDYLKYLYMIRDNKTISDEINYDIGNSELDINIDDYSDNLGITNIIKVVDSCNIEFPKSELLLPIYDCDDPSKYLFELSKKGLNKRLDGKVNSTYKERLSYELNIINKMGFCNYFLVVYDFIKYAKKNNILVGPGRGSAAGSLVAYSIGITDIDPLKYDLLFERFLNPERHSMPDIDTDFPDNKRDEVIDYVREKYGEKRVSGIVTFGTLGVKQVIRDVSRVLNIPLYKVDNLNHFIPSFTKNKLNDFYKNNASFRRTIESDSSLSRMYKIASRIEGYPRHTSSHAAGILMSKKDLDEVIPLTVGDGMYLSSYTMEYLEDLGLLKMDFLGLKNLTIISNIISDIESIYNEKIDFSNIPLDDKEALKVFEIADTTGIFQFESSGMRDFLRRLKPNTFEDIFAAIALFRPGPSRNIDTYIKRKHREEKVEYIDRSLESILKNTYGIFIYQEQIMQAARVYAGYSLGEADILRRAMSKKKRELLEKEEEKFISKAEKLGHTKEKSKEIFSLILSFAGYGFNRSHSVAYSLIAYKMAYLKVRYPLVFYTNLLTNVIGSNIKTSEYILEIKSKKIEIEKPSINISSDKYLINDNKIIYPLSNMKSIGNVVCRNIIEERNKGLFIDIYDVFSRLVRAGIGKKIFEVLIYGDVFREFKYNRATLLYNLDSLYNYGELTKDLDESLVNKPEIIFQQELDNNSILEKEKEIFGFYLSNHPTDNYRKDNPYTININEIENHFNKIVDTLILVERIKTITTKNGDKMAFVTGSDNTGSMEYTLFPKVLEKNTNIRAGNLLKIRGRVEKRLDKYQIIVDRIKDLENDE